MKFSVLLPTRNRLELLKYAVETVRRQDYSDWEVIISDNHSEQDISGYVQSLNDARIKYYRTNSFVPVTDNWNNALEKSSGDYIIMLGDDDCLMKGYFTNVEQLVKKYDSPDFIYTSAFLYAYPNVLPGCPDGFLQPYGYAEFLKAAKKPFWLNTTVAQNLVRQSINFKVVFGYNMQFAVISRRLINSLQRKGDFFQSPYPDYYSMNAMFLQGERILVYPVPMVTIGISPKSFGFYYFNDSEQSGVEFLKNLPDTEMVEKLHNVVLPGSNMNTSWLLAMETIKSNYGRELDLRVNYPRYRFLQVLHFFEKDIKRKFRKLEILKLWKLTSVGEKLSYGLFLFIASFLPRYVRKKILKILRSVLRTYPNYRPKQIAGKYSNILEVFEKIYPQDFRHNL